MIGASLTAMSRIHHGDASLLLTAMSRSCLTALVLTALVRSSLTVLVRITAIHDKYQPPCSGALVSYGARSYVAHALVSYGARSGMLAVRLPITPFPAEP